jgi:hypothetical protein
MTPAERNQCAVLGHLLTSGGVLRTVGLACSALAAALLMFGSITPRAQWLASMVVVLGGLERYVALRLGFDAGLFFELARTLDLADLDAALERLGLRAPAARPLQARIRGTLVWFYGHGACVALQLAGLVLVRLLL